MAAKNSSSATSLYWHDYETFGADPQRDRPAQFAGIRTDLDLNILGEPLVAFCKPADDMLPQPDACLVTGISPQHALAQGLPEAEFIARIHDQLSRPGTCGVGYNSVRFDDEVTRHALYRNFFDPYAREWQNGNSRWDIIDLVRLAHALRPGGIEWPKHPDGRPSFRLEDLTAANGITHVGAHDALADVRATMALARLVRERQPRMYGYVFDQRGKYAAARQLDLERQTPVLHVSSRYPSEHGCIAMVVPVARHPVNKNGVIVFDLRFDPGPLLQLGVEALQQRLFTPVADLPDGVERIPLKTVHLNKCPVLVPMSTLEPSAAERWQIDVSLGEQRCRILSGSPGLAAKVQAVFAGRRFDPVTDPDLSLYGGGFFNDADRREMERMRSATPDRLAGFQAAFDDPRVPEMLFRYRARNYPDTLSVAERERWDEYRHRRLSAPDGGGSITLEGYRARIAELREQPDLAPDKRALLDELEAYAEKLLSGLGA